MSSIGNKKVMSKNLKYYIERSGKERKELANIWGFPYSTVTEWINGNKYPRIDRIEIMADYFGIKKSDLIEDKTLTPTKKEESIVDIITMLRTDDEFLDLVKSLTGFPKDRIKAIKAMIDAFDK